MPLHREAHAGRNAAHGYILFAIASVLVVLFVWWLHATFLLIYSSALFREACLSAGANYFFDKASEFNLSRDVIERIARARPASTTG